MIQMTCLYGGGEVPPWTKGLAKFSYCALVKAGSREPFVALSSELVPCVIAPFIYAQEVRLVTFYGAKRALSPARLSLISADALIEDWEKYARAYLHCSLDPSVLPHLTAWSYEATRNAASELRREDRVERMPALAELDAALGTSLEIAEISARERVERVFDETCHLA